MFRNYKRKCIYINSMVERQRGNKISKRSRRIGHIEQAIHRTSLPVLTPLFNRNGRFFMVYGKHNVPIGFVRLVKDSDYEIVIVIGDRKKWGRN